MTRRILVVALVLLGVGGYAAWRVHQAHQPFDWSGTIEAHTMDVGSRVGGRVQEVHVREGDLVAAAAPLLTLEAGDLPAQRLQAQGQLDQAEGAFEKVAGRAMPTARRAEIAEAQARFTAQQSAEARARLDAERMRKLFAGGAGTRVDADNADLAMRAAAAQTAASRAQLDILLHGTPQDVKSAEGAVEVAKGRLQQIDVALSELVVRAPRAARVEALDLRPGDILAPNAPAARLLEPSELFVRIYVPETQLGHIRPGQEVPIYVDSFPRRAFKGLVESVAHEGEFTPRNLQTADERADQVFASRVRIIEGADVLRAGMAAFVRVPR